MSKSKPSFRGIFYKDEEPSYWKKATEPFPNRVPRFQEKKDAIEFMETYCQIGSNPDEPHLRQSISTLTCWEQIEKYVQHMHTKHCMIIIRVIQTTKNRTPT